MIIALIVWIGLSIAIGSSAGRRGRSGFAWFLLSLLLSPLIAGLFLLLAGPAPSFGAAEGTKICPRCAEHVQYRAVVCRFCGHEFEAVAEPPPRRSSTAAIFWTLLSLIVFAILVVGWFVAEP